MSDWRDHCAALKPQLDFYYQPAKYKPNVQFRKRFRSLGGQLDSLGSRQDNVTDWLAKASSFVQVYEQYCKRGNKIFLPQLVSTWLDYEAATGRANGVRNALLILSNTRRPEEDELLAVLEWMVQSPPIPYEETVQLIEAEISEKRETKSAMQCHRKDAEQLHIAFTRLQKVITELDRLQTSSTLPSTLSVLLDIAREASGDLLSTANVAHSHCVVHFRLDVFFNYLASAVESSAALEALLTIITKLPLERREIETIEQVEAMLQQVVSPASKQMRILLDDWIRNAFLLS